MNARHGTRGDAELEALLAHVDRMIDQQPHREQMLSRMRRGLRGQAGRFPARHLASWLRQQGFLVSHHFLERLHQRAQQQGIRFDPRLFGREFRQAQHYRQTRPGYNTRIAVMRGLPVLYRVGGQGGNRVVLVGLLPEGALPPVQPVGAPQSRESETTMN